MSRIYLVVGTLICILFIYASMRGWTIIDPFGPVAAKPTGGAHYHK